MNQDITFCQDKVYTLGPSRFAFGYDECRWCFYMQATGRLKPPRGPMPSIFSNIDNAMKTRYRVGGSHSMEGLDQSFKVHSAGKWVESQAIAFPDCAIGIKLRGPYDSILLLEDGSLAVCDFKTSLVKPQYLAKYWRQLHSYAHALENPQRGSPLPIPRLGLAVYEPFAYNYDDGGTADLKGNICWIEMQRDDDRFISFLADVAKLLASDTPPDPNPCCTNCTYYELRGTLNAA